MTDLYRMTWQKKGDKQTLTHVGPILRHQKANPHWRKETTPYTHKEALAACKKWNRICPAFKHNIIPVVIIKAREEAHDGNLSTSN